MKFWPVTRAWLGALLALLAPCVARAQAHATPAAGAAQAQAATPASPLRVWVEAQGLPLDSVRLCETLSRELKREVTLVSDAGAADVRIQLESERRARVRYVTPDRETLTRDVELPPDGERTLQVLSWLTVNLVRDEASELLAQLRARQRAEARARAAEEEAAREREAARLAAAEAAAAAARAKAQAAAAARITAEAAAARARAQAATREPQAALLYSPFKSVDAALATPTAVLPDAAKRVLHLQLALGYGDAGEIRGAQVSPSVLRIRRDLAGISVAAGFALVGSNARGLVVSGGYPRVNGTLAGIAVGGGVASAGSLRGGLVAGGAAWLSEASYGSMIAGAANLAGELSGAQISGGINIARDLRGVAIAPINVQRRVRGVQLGVINIADEIDGAAIGVVSLAENGRFQPVLWASGDRSAHFALKSIAGSAFTQLGGGVLLDGERFSYEGGLGAHLELGRGVFLEPGVHYSATHETRDASGAPDAHYLHYLAQLGVRVGAKLDLFGGAGIRHLIAGGSDATLSPEARAGIGFF